MLNVLAIIRTSTFRNLNRAIRGCLLCVLSLFATFAVLEPETFSAFHLNIESYLKTINYNISQYCVVTLRGWYTIFLCPYECTMYIIYANLLRE